MGYWTKLDAGAPPILKSMWKVRTQVCHCRIHVRSLHTSLMPTSHPPASQRICESGAFVLPDLGLDTSASAWWTDNTFRANFPSYQANWSQRSPRLPAFEYKSSHCLQAYQPTFVSVRRHPSASTHRSRDGVDLFWRVPHRRLEDCLRTVGTCGLGVEEKDQMEACGTLRSLLMS